MRVVEVQEVADGLVSAMAGLIPQLTSSCAPPSRRELDEIVKSPSVVLFVAREGGLDGKIVGTLSLVLFRVPTGVRARIEDLVVDEKARRRGAGEALVRAALLRAERAGARAVDLTSNPARQAANRLYAELGFERWNTNVYRYPLARPS